MITKQDLKKVPTYELQGMLAELDWMIEEYECYCANDLILREEIEKELAKRRFL